MAVMFFAVMSLKSRALSLLNAVRPTPSSVDETKRPGWAPPGIVFPIVWCNHLNTSGYCIANSVSPSRLRCGGCIGRSTIGVLRTVSSVMIWEVRASQPERILRVLRCASPQKFIFSGRRECML
jgi:hypothetical protein